MYANVHVKIINNTQILLHIPTNFHNFIFFFFSYVNIYIGGVLKEEQEKEDSELSSRNVIVSKERDTEGGSNSRKNSASNMGSSTNISSSSKNSSNKNSINTSAKNNHSNTISTTTTSSSYANNTYIPRSPVIKIPTIPLNDNDNSPLLVHSYTDSYNSSYNGNILNNLEERIEDLQLSNIQYRNDNENNSNNINNTNNNGQNYNENDDEDDSIYNKEKRSFSGQFSIDTSEKDLNSDFDKDSPKSEG